MSYKFKGKKCLSRLSSGSGFTLLEIMIAITILSLIMGVVYSSFSAISESDRKISLASETALRARNLFGMMTKEISSVFVPAAAGGSGEAQDRLNYGFVCTADGEMQRLDFTAAISDSGRISDATLKEISYFLKPKEGGGNSLFKRMDATPDDDISSGGRDFFLMDDVASLRYEFVKGEDEPTAEWESLTKASLPKIVRVELSLINKESDIETFVTTIPIYLAKTF